MRPTFICFLLTFTLLFAGSFTAQKILRVNYQSFGVSKKQDYYINDKISYKLKAGLFYRQNKLINFYDTSVVMDNYITYGFNTIKAIKINHASFHNLLFQKLFLYAGIGYPTVYAVNALILGYRPILSDKALVLSASFLVTSYLIKQLGISRVKMKRKGFIKVLDLDFDHLNTP